ncbi:MAG TPA: hypothetical protein VFJ02_08380 [Vicinamibacterales bacterium]|nr:hypothetical protein [Vicinamibacterales bacterium]
MNGRRSLVTRSLRRVWWPLWPAFLALAVRLGIERGCGDAYDLLPALVSNPAWAWPLALVYVAAHAWIIGAYLVTVSAAGRLAPGLDAWRAMWGRNLATVILMLAAMAIEYAPVPLWRMIMAAAGCGR